GAGAINSALTVNSGTVMVTGTGNSLTGTGTITLNSATGTNPGKLFAPTFGAAATALTINNVLAGPNGIQKLGQGRIALNGANTYAGQTDLTEGVLLVSNSSGLGVSSPIVSSSTQFDGTGVTATPTRTFGANSPTIAVSSATNVSVGMVVTGAGIPANTTVTSVAGTTITLSNNTTAAGT